LFCIGGGGGYAFNFLSLAECLGPQQAVYALHARGLESRARTDWTVAGHARRHLASIRSVQPAGPYLLVGFSFGGLIAYEIAQQLLADGEEVAHLAILDTPLPAPDLAKGAGGNALRRVGVAVRTILRTATSPLGRVKSCFLPLVGLVRFPGHHNVDMFWLWSGIMVNLYEITPYPGQATLYLASTGSRASGERWAELLAAGGRQVVVSGDHNGMMRKPNVTEIAADLRSRIPGLARTASTQPAAETSSTGPGPVLGPADAERAR
jgi:thioesterase domain-containing protein